VELDVKVESDSDGMHGHRDLVSRMEFRAMLTEGIAAHMPEIPRLR
jgi:hypothetical protein